MKKLLLGMVAVSAMLLSGLSANAVTISDTATLNGTAHPEDEVVSGLPEGTFLFFFANSGSIVNTSASPYVLTEPGNPTWISDIIGVCNCEPITGNNALAFMSDSDTSGLPASNSM